jgi:hypothetical protein
VLQKRLFVCCPWGSITIVAAGLCALAAGLSCPSGTVAPAPPLPPGWELTVFFTGSELGSLRPCGCSGGQLGGIEKRTAIFNRVPASRRLIVATGELVQNDREQDLMKFRVLFEAFNLLHYDVTNLTRRDYGIADRLGLVGDPQSTVPILHADEQGRPARFTRQLTAGDRAVAVNIMSLPSLSGAGDLSRPSDESGANASTLNILVLDQYDSDVLAGRAESPSGIDCIVCPSPSEEPQLLSKPGDVPLVFSIGRFGRYVVRLDVTMAAGADRPSLRFEALPITGDLPDDPALVRLYGQYRQLVAQSDLLENYPRLPLGEKLTYVGSDKCNECHDHQAEYDQWLATDHAHAFAALKNVGSDRDPECVICHVSGLEYESGFVNEAKTPELIGVGCENCHGPGSAHVQGHGKVLTTEPKTACNKCHTPEHDGEFAGHEEEKMKKIMHWKERAAPDNVKK